MTDTTTASAADAARRAALVRHLEVTGVDGEVRRITGTGDIWVAECPISYDGGPWKPAASIHELRDGKIAVERIDTTEPWPAPAWRAGWWAGWRANPCPPTRALPTSATVAS